MVAHIAQYADTEAISLRDLEKLFVQVATALNKAGMKELAKDAAGQCLFKQIDQLTISPATRLLPGI